MTLRHTLIIPAMLCIPATAYADVTADEVWTNLTAYYSATGAEVTGGLDRSGDVVTVNDMTLAYTLPMGFGDFTVAMPPMTLTENGGAVDMSYPDAFNVSINGTMGGETFDVALDVTMNDYQGTATGEAGNVTYETSAGEMTAKLAEASTSADDADIDGVFLASVEGYDLINTITEGEMIEGTSKMTLQPSVVNYSVGAGDAFSTKSATRYESMTTTSSFALPAGGSDVMNLTPAFEAGMFLESTSQTEGTSTKTTTTMNGEVSSDQSTKVGTSEGTLRLDASGLSVDGSASDFEMTFQDQTIMPFPVTASAASATANYQVPVLASEDPQDFRLQFGLDQLELSDDIWSMIDAGQQLPRDPAIVNLDVAGSVLSELDFFDFQSLENAFAGGKMPVKVDRANINDITISAIGASAEATGEFVFDNEDMTTFPGVPRPEGSASVDVVGANALMDRLVAMGLLPEDQVFGARMMIGMFARETGDDQLNSTIEINPEGHVLVNGERIR